MRTWVQKSFTKTSNINLIPSDIQRFVNFKQHVLKLCEPTGLLLSNQGQYDCKDAKQSESKITQYCISKYVLVSLNIRFSDCPVRDVNRYKSIQLPVSSFSS